MIIYLKNMACYKMEFFKGMTYDKVRPIFKREYKKVQTLFKPDKDVQETKKKRVADETLLQESFKKLRAAEEIHTEGSRLYWKIIRVEGITKAYQFFEDILKGFDIEELVALWNLVKEKFSSAVPSEEKDYPLSNVVMILMLSGKLQVEEDNEMARDLVMKIFMEANKSRSRNLRKMHKEITAAGLTLLLLMRIEQYFLMTDYSLWEVILNGDSPVPTRIVEGVVQPVAPTTTEQKLARKDELKARDAKKSNEMYYTRFTKVIINFFITKDPSTPRRNKVNWHYVKDDKMFMTIKLVSRHQNTQQFGAMFPIELTNEDIRNSAAYKEYYAIASGAESLKKKASVKKTQSNNNIDDFVHPKLSTHDEEAKEKESFDPIVQTLSHEENSDDEGNDEASHDMNVGGDEGPDAKDDDEELYRDVNINLEVITTVEPLLLTVPSLPSPSLPTISQIQQAPAPSPATAPSTYLQDLPNFGSLFGFDHRLMTLKSKFSEFIQTNQFAKSVSSIPSIVDRYIDHRMKEAVKVAVQLQSDKLRGEAEADNEDFLNKLDENIQKIIKEQVKDQVKTSYDVAGDLSELVLKKILIEKIESNKSIHRSDEQRNLYKALVDAYECNKIILDTYGDMVMLKRRSDDEDKDEEPSVGSDRGSKRRRTGKEPESTSAPKEKTSKTSGKSTEGSKSYQKTASESALAEEPMYTTLDEPSHQEFKTGATDDQPVTEGFQYPECFHKQTKPPTPDHAWNKTLPATHRTFLMNRLKVDTLTPELLAGPTYELMKGSCKSLMELELFLEEVYKGIRMKYLPQTIWRRSDKERAAAMIQTIDKQLKKMKIMRSLEKFVGGRLYD
nr:hypothetical protein [Tanacetum cinerariifolium]